MIHLWFKAETLLTLQIIWAVKQSLTKHSSLSAAEEDAGDAE